MSPLAVLLMLTVLSGPRSFGYFIGDEITLQTEVAWARGFELERASLPRPGPVTYWLDLKSVETREVQAGRYRLRLHYQTFYAPLGVQALDVPGFTLAATRAGERVELPVDGWRFSMSPLLGVGSRDRNVAVTIREDVAPQPVSLAPAIAAGTTCFAVAMSSLLALAFHRAWGPFRRRAARPFAQAAHAIRLQPSSAAGYLAALLSLHRAFDMAAGRRVLSDDLGELLRQFPRFADVGEDIQIFFRASRRAFFGEDLEGAMEHLSPAQLAVLGARLAAAERESS